MKYWFLCLLVCYIQLDCESVHVLSLCAVLLAWDYCAVLAMREESSGNIPVSKITATVGLREAVSKICHLTSCQWVELCLGKAQKAGWIAGITKAETGCSGGKMMAIQLNKEVNHKLRQCDFVTKKKKNSRDWGFSVSLQTGFRAVALEGWGWAWKVFWFISWLSHDSSDSHNQFSMQYTVRFYGSLEDLCNIDVYWLINCHWSCCSFSGLNCYI